MEETERLLRNNTNADIIEDRLGLESTKLLDKPQEQACLNSVPMLIAVVFLDPPKSRIHTISLK